VRLLLVAGDLQGVGELRVLFARGQAAADAAEPEDGQQPGQGQAERGGPGDQPDSPGSAGGGTRAVGPGVVELSGEQPVELRADGGVSGGQLRGRRRIRPDRQAGRAEQVPDRGPLLAERLDVIALGPLVAGVKLVQRGQLGVDRGQRSGIEGGEELGTFGPGGEQRGLPGGVGRVHAPGHLAGHDRGGQLVAGDRAALDLGRASTRDTDGGHRHHHERERDAEHDERAGGSPGKRSHSPDSNGRLIVITDCRPG
jgi:hypothetical protein